LQARQRAPAWSLGARYDVEIDVYRSGRFDLDNVIKSALDGCTGILWKDDAQVVEIHARRRQADGEGERLVLVVAPVAA
jgi:Holliday junction resolvase RusA-like endonuclease